MKYFNSENITEHEQVTKKLFSSIYQRNTNETKVVPYFAMCDAHLFAHIFEGKTRVCIMGSTKSISV